MLTNQSNGNVEFKLRLFRAQDDPIAARIYFAGQKEALADFDINNTTSLKIAHTDPNVYLLCAESSDGKQQGGLCCYAFAPTNALPIEKAIGSLEPKLHQKLAYFSREGVAEYCAGWVNRDSRGSGLYAEIIRAMIAVMPTLRLRYAVAFGCESSMKFYRRFGMLSDNSLGENGKFQYPDERFLSVVGLLECKALNETKEREKIEITKIREGIETARPDTTFTFDSITYCLELLRDFPILLAAAA